MTGNFFAQFKPCELNTEQKLLPKPLLSGIPVHPRELISLRRAGPHRIPYIGGGLVIQFLAYERIPLLFLKTLTRTSLVTKIPLPHNPVKAGAEAGKISAWLKGEMDRTRSAPSPADTKCL